MILVLFVYLSTIKMPSIGTIDHGMLQTKLNTYGIRGIVNNWLNSYLHNTDRQQYVNINDQDSDMANVVCVCVASHNDLLLGQNYLYYISMTFVTPSLLKLIIFADDTTIFWSLSDVNELSRNMSNGLVKLSI